MDLSGLRGAREGETGWVLGSGATLNHLDSGFFAGKLTVSTNLGPVRFGVRPDFVFTHYHNVVVQALEVGCTVVTLAGDTLTQKPWQGDRPDRLVLVEQPSYVGPSDRFDPNGPHRPQGTLVYGSSSIHGAMHLAAWLGCRHIVLVGADCGRLDGNTNLAGYPVLGGQGDTDRILSLYERDLRRMKAYLQAEYGVGVYSLNPFVNLNLEGHTFRGPDNRYPVD